MYGGAFKQNYGWYANKQAFEWGLDPLSLQFLLNRCPDEIIDAILNHVKKGVIGVYNRNKYDKEKKKWLLKWAKYLEVLVSPPTDK